ncbi:MAG: calcium channel protein [Phylliscum demangeonii]|nr:MAG: calcium channel protein [Phylliscum demangeonii]
MASQRHGDPLRRTPQPAPSQAQFSPPDSDDITNGGRGAAEDGDGNRRFSRARDSVGNRLRQGRRYERLSEGSPSPMGRAHPTLSSVIAGPSNPQQTFYHEEHDGDHSPVDDPGAFQAAVGFAGLSLPHGHREPEAPPMTFSSALPSRGTDFETLPDLSIPFPDLSPQSTPTRRPSDDLPPQFLLSQETDTTPLTQSQLLQPSAAGYATPRRSADHDRTSFHSVQLSNHASPGARLGDELITIGMETERDHRRTPGGSSSSHLRRPSLSPAGSTISRAGTIVRKMSQRVINLSNEPEAVEPASPPSSSTQPDSLPARPSSRQSAPEHPYTANIELFPLPSTRKPSVGPSDQGMEYQQPHPTPISQLKGRALGVLPANNILRERLCDLLVHPATQPMLLALIILQTVLLAIESAPNVTQHARPGRWGNTWIDYVLLAIFIIYTIEVVIRIMVSGFLFNPEEYSTIDRRLGWRKALTQRLRDMFSTRPHPTRDAASDPFEGPRATLFRVATADAKQQRRFLLTRRAFLRHSFNRLDFLAVVSFWISFGLQLTGQETTRHLFVFRMLSCLRILRLLFITKGTYVILHSLKRAAPMLVNVAFLIGFFWLLFAIVGIQSFKSSFRRQCQWRDPTGALPPTNYPTPTLCGGHLNSNTSAPESYIRADGKPSGSHKGFLCPRHSFCVEQDNIYSGTVSFDNILHSLELVFVIMSSNTFTDLLYKISFSDYLYGALFFAAGQLLLSFWLLNLLVAVITSTFQVIREESKKSAFSGSDSDSIRRNPSLRDREPSPRRISTMKRLYDRTSWVWIILIVYGLIAQGIRSSSMDHRRKRFIDVSETLVTFLLLLEIIIRFAVDWRKFHKRTRNWIDLGLVIVTSIMQIPVIHRSGQPYAWLTVFQIVRIYRVVLFVPITRELITVVVGNATGILNLIVFVYLLTFLGAIFASQLFRGVLPSLDDGGNPVKITFFSIYNSFLGMYQILSSENWTDILYAVTSNESKYGTGWIGASFLALWFVLGNFIVLNMFIALIQENFDISEDDKLVHQVRTFLQRKELGAASQGDAVLNEFLQDRRQLPSPMSPAPKPVSFGAAKGPGDIRSGRMKRWWYRAIHFYRGREPNPFYSSLQLSRAYNDADPKLWAQELLAAQDRQRREQREYLNRHRHYNMSLFLFKPSNPVRRFCQFLVGPGRGERVEGPKPVNVVSYSFSAFIYVATVAMVILACFTTPLQQKEYLEKHPKHGDQWFVFVDLAFAILFTVEAATRIIADGFFWTPNAFFRSSWGLLDGVVIVTLWINVGTSWRHNALDGAGSRALGAFKALRALRLLNLSASARNTFHSVVVDGVWKVISSAFVSLSLLIPFAIYGLNLFNDQMKICNDADSSIRNLTTDCVGEFMNNASHWNVLSPRSVENPYYNFDTFGSSVFILFQIVSQEGWIDVMWSAMSANGRGMMPQPFATPGNALFFVVFNLLGSVFVLTLFITVLRRYHMEQTGVAYLTAEQRSWMEMRKLLRQIRPSKRRSQALHSKWVKWCYRQSKQKNGWWQRIYTTVLLLHLLLLVLEFYPMALWWDRTRDVLFLAFTVFYLANIFVRIIGLSWARFRSSSWDLYSVFAVGGTFVTTVLRLINLQERTIVQLQKFFLVLIALLLIPRNNQLDQLFKTAAASLSAITNLMATWFVLFLVYAIALTHTLGLTKFGGLENSNLNFRTVPKALILLFRMSVGEAWNEIMEDYAMMQAPRCFHADKFLDSDCGSTQWARALLVSWNILSMYLFVSLFVSLILESFSYVYQRSSGLSIVTREEIRKFKQAWATYDQDGTGYISKETFPRLLAELSGVFEMQIYHGEFNVGRILEACRPDAGSAPGRVVDGVDLDKLGTRVSKIPVDEIRRRRKRLNTFYEEIFAAAETDRGIAFTTVLMHLAHHTVINDKYLRLEEFLRRRARLQRVEEQVRRNTVAGFFDMMYCMRYRQRQHASRLQSVPTFAVPEIIVAGEDGVISEPHAPDGGSFPAADAQDSLGARPSSSSLSSSPSSHASGRSAWQSHHPQSSSLDVSVGANVQLRNRTGSMPSAPIGPDARLGPRTHLTATLSPYRGVGGGGGGGGGGGAASVDAGTTGAGPSPAGEPGSRTSSHGDGGSYAGGSRSGGGGHSPRPSVSGGGDGDGDEQQQRLRVLDMLDHSAWGASIRRSVSVRRLSREDV